MGQLGQQRVAIYCRVSTAEQDCARQERDLRAYASRARFKIVGIFKETASGARNDRIQRKKVLDLAQARRIDAVLVTELSRWGRSTSDLVNTLQDLQSWRCSLLAQSGFQFDLGTPQGKLIAQVLSAIAEFERDLLRERVRSGIAAARARGKIFGRRPGQRPKSDRLAPRVLEMIAADHSYREIACALRISKNTVTDIVKRNRAGAPDKAVTVPRS